MPDQQNHKLESFLEVLNRAGSAPHISHKIDDLICINYIINVGINAITALTGLPNGRLLDFEETRQLMAELVAEAVAVAKTKGIHLTYSDPLDTVYEVARKTAQNRSSMLQDFDRKKPSEIAFINGDIVREAEALGLNAPVNRTITKLVRTLDARHRKE